MTVFTESFDIGDGRIVSIETGKLARQADGAVLVRMGKAALLATVVSAQKPRPGADFFPLSVDYQEKFAAAGRIPGGFFRREARLSDYEVLICRLIDRTIRPLFADNYINDTQINIWLLSHDPEVVPDTLAGLAASACLTISDIPFLGPISEVRVAKIDGQYRINPTKTEIEKATLDIIVGASIDNVMMVEGEAHEAQEAEFIEAIRVGHDAIKLQCEAQKRLAEKCGNKPKRTVEQPASDEALKTRIFEFGQEGIYQIASSGLGKQERKEGFTAVEEAFKAQLITELPEGETALSAETSGFVKEYFHDLQKSVVRNMMLDERIRLDGRLLDEIRPIEAEVDLLASPHGCALFTRGETQSITSVTLGTKLDELMLDKAEGLSFQKFILHYNFPGFSTGEVKINRGPGRREVGHGNLAMRSLKQMLPSDDENPYTIRIVSDILESNGSSSMATVCAGSLALMDAGIKIKKPVSGIAMGLITDGGRFAVLSDILGDEDHLGDMDFKVTGTADGICGMQMDLKIDGLPYEIMLQAFEQARQGRIHILGKMAEAMSEPREELKPHAPRVIKLFVDREFIGAIIGTGGKVIQEMQRETGAIINIEEKDNRGEVTISSPNNDSIQAALKRINDIIAIPEEGQTYEGPVKTITDFGAFVEFMPGKDGLLHISEISWERLDTMDGIFKEGEIVQVKLIGVDPKNGKFKLSRKALLPPPEGYVPREPRERSNDRDRNDRGGNFRNDRNNDRRGGPPNRR
jgi:polyribonucleotide nucleotidyltransferase